MFLKVFPPFLCQKIESLPSILALWSFLKIDVIDLLLSIFEKDLPWSNRSFDHKKCAIQAKNQWLNSQPCKKQFNSFLLTNIPAHSEEKGQGAGYHPYAEITKK